MATTTSLNGQIKRYSISQEIYQQIIQPILDSEKLENPQQLLELLKMLNAQLWQTEQTQPKQIKQALEELTEIYRFAVTLGQKVHICEHATPHFGPREVEVETHRIEFSDDQEQNLKNHIAHLAAHLSAPSKFKTRVKSKQKVVELMVTPPFAFQAKDDESIINRYKKVVEKALEQGYHSAETDLSAKDLSNMTQKVIITTPSLHLYFLIIHTKKVLFDGSSNRLQASKLAQNSQIHQHWDEIKQKTATASVTERKKAQAEGIDFNNNKSLVSA